MLFKPQVADFSVTTGTGTMKLSNSPPPNHRSFAAFTSADLVTVKITDENGNWEVSIGTYTAATGSAPATVTRTTVLGSSNGGNRVNFGPGDKHVESYFNPDTHRQVPIAVGSLPTAASSAGMRRVVNDSNAALTAGIGAVVAAGGANIVPVFCNGTDWRIG